MKKSYLYLAIVVFVGCALQVEEMPTDLNGLKGLLATKQTALNDLAQEIASLEEKIATMDSSIEEPTKLVTAIMAERKDFKHFVTIQGSVDADESVNVSSEAAGRILSLSVDEGDYLRKGALVATVDMESVEKQIAEVEKSHELATEVYDRQARLWNQNIGSEIQYLQAKNNKERLEKSLETLQFQLQKANVYAPLAGTVDMVLLEEGELASPGMPILQILNTRKLKVVADAPENLLGSVRAGDEVQVILPSIRDSITARVTQLGRRIDPANRTFTLETSLPAKHIYKPNLLAEIRVNDYTEKDVIVIPLELVQQEVGGQDFVMVTLPKDGVQVAEKRYVSTGDSYEGEIVIKSGLTDSTQLVLDGARNLSVGEMIEIASDQNQD